MRWMDRIAALPATVGLTVGTVLVGLIGWADWLTGIEVRVYPFYFLPISLVTINRGMRSGSLICVLSGTVWLSSNIVPTMEHRSPLLLAWNTVAQLSAFFVVMGLIGKQKHQYDRERQLAREDPLTGLANARAFREMLRAEIVRATRYEHGLTLAYLDLDNFKTVNDRQGHSVGDELLTVFAASLRTHLRATDVIARLGGDEFAVLLPEVPADGVPPVLEKLQAVTRQLMQQRGWPVTVSIGAITFTAPPADEDALIGQADQVMYAVKASGKDAFKHEVRDAAAAS